MITSWKQFNEWRAKSLAYHQNYGMDKAQYSNALTFFEYARKYFQINGFPVQTEKYKNGKLKPWSTKDKKKQKEELNKWMKENL